MKHDTGAPGSVVAASWVKRMLDRQVAMYRRAPWKAAVSVLLSIGIVWLIWRPGAMSAVPRLFVTVLMVATTVFLLTSWELSLRRSP